MPNWHRVIAVGQVSTEMPSVRSIHLYLSYNCLNWQPVFLLTPSVFYRSNPGQKGCCRAGFGLGAGIETFDLGDRSLTGHNPNASLQLISCGLHLSRVQPLARSHHPKRVCPGARQARAHEEIGIFPDRSYVCKKQVCGDRRGHHSWCFWKIGAFPLSSSTWAVNFQHQSQNQNTLWSPLRLPSAYVASNPHRTVPSDMA